MHSANNDFIVLDLRNRHEPTPEFYMAISDQYTGGGCDLALGIEVPRSSEALAFFHIWTANRQASIQYGNGTRCIATRARRAGSAVSPGFRIGRPPGPVEITSLGRDLYSVQLVPSCFEPSSLLISGTREDNLLLLVSLPDGTLQIAWPDDRASIVITGPAIFVF